MAFFLFPAFSSLLCTFFSSFLTLGSPVGKYWHIGAVTGQFTPVGKWGCVCAPVYVEGSALVSPGHELPNDFCGFFSSHCRFGVCTHFVLAQKAGKGRKNGCRSPSLEQSDELLSWRGRFDGAHAPSVEQAAADELLLISSRLQGMVQDNSPRGKSGHSLRGTRWINPELGTRTAPVLPPEDLEGERCIQRALTPPPPTAVYHKCFSCRAGKAPGTQRSSVPRPFPDRGRSGERRRGLSSGGGRRETIPPAAADGRLTVREDVRVKSPRRK